VEDLPSRSGRQGGKARNKEWKIFFVLRKWAFKAKEGYSTRGVVMGGMEVLALAGVLVLVALGLAWYFWFMRVRIRRK
jgi:hypothetical protein